MFLTLLTLMFFPSLWRQSFVLLTSFSKYPTSTRRPSEFIGSLRRGETLRTTKWDITPSCVTELSSVIRLDSFSIDLSFGPFEFFILCTSQFWVTPKVLELNIEVRTLTSIGESSLTDLTSIGESFLTDPIS